MKETFKALDRNGDGCLTLEELRLGLNEVKNGEELLELMKAADTDNSGTINYTGKKIYIIILIQIILIIFSIEFIAATIDA